MTNMYTQGKIFLPFFNSFLFPVIAGGFLFACPEAVNAGECEKDKRLLFLNVDSSVEQNIDVHFGIKLLEELRAPLQEIEYCIKQAPDLLTEPDSAYSDDFLLYLTAACTENFDDHDSSSRRNCAINAGLLGKGERSDQAFEQARDRPLVRMPFVSSDSSTFYEVLAQKIVENLRTQYLCHLHIESEPSGAQVGARSGLSATTPLEWVVPVGEITIHATKEKYAPLTKNIQLSHPGNHTYVLQMKKPPFFRSPFFYSSLALGTASLAAFAYSQYQYREKYQALGRPDRESNPDLFEQTYHRAETAEKAAQIGLGFAAMSLSISFFIR
ncbi:MAG: PEGA domain-containing protein [Chitinivibrionales bacterium]|nr:PEGA domain-containing protein [Chitinivibrionales bacterium]